MDCQSVVIWARSSSNARLTLKLESFTSLNLGRSGGKLKMNCRIEEGSQVAEDATPSGRGGLGGRGGRFVELPGIARCPMAINRLWFHSESLLERDRYHEKNGFRTTQAAGD